MTNILHIAPKAAPVFVSEADRNARLGAFFRSHRIEADLSLEAIAGHLELESVETVIGYESGAIGMPVDDIFALTNFLNIPPEDVMELILELYLVGTS